MTGSIFIEGENISLRTLEEDDAEFIAKNRNHPEMHSLLLQKTPMSLDEAEEMITNREDIDFLIINEDTKIGAISVSSIDERESNAEIGYFITPKQQSEGYGTEAINLVLNYIFNELGIHKVGALTYEHNQASQKVLENCGFKKEGTLIQEKFIDGSHRDCPRYGITVDDWRDD